jgi:hypothetical protein
LTPVEPARPNIAFQLFPWFRYSAFAFFAFLARNACVVRREVRPLPAERLPLLAPLLAVFFPPPRRVLGVLVFLCFMARE